MHLNLYAIYSWHLILDPLFICPYQRWHSPTGNHKHLNKNFWIRRPNTCKRSPAVLLHHLLETVIAKSLFYCYFCLAVLLFCELSPWSFSVLPAVWSCFLLDVLLSLPPSTYEENLSALPSLPNRVLEGTGSKPKTDSVTGLLIKSSCNHFLLVTDNACLLSKL